MMKIETKAKKMQERIDRAIAQAKEHNITANFHIADNSVQKELRLCVTWGVTYNVDEIKYPQRLDVNANAIPWMEMHNIANQIQKRATLDHDSHRETIPINEQTKTGPRLRAEARAAFLLKHGTIFLDNLRKSSTKTRLATLRRDISVLQSQQKEVIKEMRKVNSATILARKEAKAEREKRNQDALTSGEFWKADRDTLKDYFHPPFQKNYLADVSEKWRAALFTECESQMYKDWRGNKRHKLVGTGRGYLCGIDDNGDEWGHAVTIEPGYDEFSDPTIDATVEEAMAELFEIPVQKLENCYRQGDLLFCPELIPKDHRLEMRVQTEPWEVRESHIISGELLERNHEYFQSPYTIKISHTSHQPVTLPAGEYKLYTLQVQDAD